MNWNGKALNSNDKHIAMNKQNLPYDGNGQKRIADYTLVALTIMIAESRMEEKEMMISIVMHCIG